MGYLSRANLWRKLRFEKFARDDVTFDCDPLIQALRQLPDPYTICYQARSNNAAAIRVIDRCLFVHDDGTAIKRQIIYPI